MFESAIYSSLHIFISLIPKLLLWTASPNNSSRRRSSFIVSPNGYNKSSMEYVLPLLLLPILLGRQGLLFAWVIYQYPMESILKNIKDYWSKSSPKIRNRLSNSINRIEDKFLCSSTATLFNQIIFFTLCDKLLSLDRRNGLYSLVFYNFLVYSCRYVRQLSIQGKETWASVSISDSTNIRHLAMSATKLVLEWTKLVTFIATLITFLLVLQLDSSTLSSSFLPPMKYTILTLAYYFLTEEKVGIFILVTSTKYTIIIIEQIQGLELLYFKIFANGIVIFLNVLLILPLLKSNPKLCLLATYHNVYLQYRLVKRIKVTIDREWHRINSFRSPGSEELKELNDLCPVCLNDLVKWSVRVTNCRHYFHANCLRLYLKESRLESCPLCKRPLFV